VVEDLDAADLVPDGGSWGAVLFDNPRIGLPPSLYWWVTFRYLDIGREWGETSCQLDAEWIVLGPTDWRAMTPTAVSYPTFGAPAEASLYYFDHHRFESLAVVVGEQRGHRLFVRIDLAGDLDGLGLPALRAEAWLDFEALVVAVSDRPPTVDAARSLLGAYTSVEALTGREERGNYRFTPDRPGPSPS
jgi:hypothetical protein